MDQAVRNSMPVSTKCSYSMDNSMSLLSQDRFGKIRDINIVELYEKKKLKEHVVDFKCWQNMEITTLKEFFEIFIESIKESLDFHTDILNSQYKEIGLSITFNAITSMASLRVVLL